jgi:hypothetical protein
MTDVRGGGRMLTSDIKGGGRKLLSDIRGGGRKPYPRVTLLVTSIVAFVLLVVRLTDIRGG